MLACGRLLKFCPSCRPSVCGQEASLHVSRRALGEKREGEKGERSARREHSPGIKSVVKINAAEKQPLCRPEKPRSLARPPPCTWSARPAGAPGPTARGVSMGGCARDVPDASTGLIAWRRSRKLQLTSNALARPSSVERDRSWPAPGVSPLGLRHV